MPESSFDAVPINPEEDGAAVLEPGLSELLSPLDEIEDMDKIFETYERQFINNQHFDEDQLLVDTSADTISQHIIKSRASDLDDVSDASGDGQNVLLATSDHEFNGVVATVRSVLEDLNSSRQVIANQPINTTSEDNNRTIIVVVTTNIVTNIEPMEPSKGQHAELSFGLNNLLSFLPTAPPQPRLDLHNRITTEFFNGELLDTTISIEGVARSEAVTPTETITDAYQDVEQMATNLPRLTEHRIAESVDEGTFTILPEEIIADVKVAENSTPAATVDEIDQILISTMPITKDDVVVTAQPETNRIQPEHTSQASISNDDVHSIIGNMPDDRIPDIIESIPHEEVRNKYLQDIPKEDHIPMASKVEHPLGIPDDARRLEDINEYVVEDLPIKISEGRSTNINNSSPDKCMVLVDGVPYVPTQCLDNVKQFGKK